MRLGMLAVACLLVPMLGAGPALADTTLKVSKRDCNRLVQHQPSADVAYKAGVDVRGKKVKTADADGTVKLDLPEEITIPITFDIAEKYGVGTAGKFAGESVVGKVTVKGGRTYWNGKPLDNEDQAAIAAACQKVYGKRR